MKIADSVYAVFVVGDKRLQLLFEVEDSGEWTLLGAGVEVLEQLGPLHLLPDGSTAKAFTCLLRSEEGGDLLPPFAQQAFVNRSDAVQMPLALEPIARIIWDGFSIMESPIAEWPNTSPSGVTGVFCDPKAEHILVEERQDKRLEWRRYDPNSPTRYIEPS